MLMLMPLTNSLITRTYLRHLILSYESNIPKSLIRKTAQRVTECGKPSGGSGLLPVVEETILAPAM